MLYKILDTAWQSTSTRIRVFVFPRFMFALHRELFLLVMVAIVVENKTHTKLPKGLTFRLMMQTLLRGSIYKARYSPEMALAVKELRAELESYLDRETNRYGRTRRNPQHDYSLNSNAHVRS